MYQPEGAWYCLMLLHSMRDVLARYFVAEMVQRAIELAHPTYSWVRQDFGFPRVEEAEDRDPKLAPCISNDVLQDLLHSLDHMRRTDHWQNQWSSKRKLND